MVETIGKNYESEQKGGLGDFIRNFKKYVEYGRGFVDPTYGTYTLGNMAYKKIKDAHETKEAERDPRKAELTGEMGVEIIESQKKLKSKLSQLGYKEGDTSFNAYGVDVLFDDNGNIIEMNCDDYYLGITNPKLFATIKDPTGEIPDYEMDPMTMGEFRILMRLIDENLDARINKNQKTSKEIFKGFHERNKKLADLIEEHNNSEDDPDAYLAEQLNNLT